MNWKTWVILGAVLLLLFVITAWQLAPRVVLLEPVEDELHGRQPVMISFSRSMDPASVEERFSLMPSLDGNIIWNDAFDQLSFTPAKSWPAGTSVLIEIKSGALSRLRLPTLSDYQDTLNISPFLLIYMWPAVGSSNLYLANPETGDSQALTDETAGILDYTVGPDGLSIIYSISNENGTSSIKSLDRQTGLSTILLECTTGLCRSPQISLDGSHLAYEFISREPGIPPGVRVFNLSEDNQINPGLEGDYLEKPLWGSSGWLVFYNQSKKGYEFWNPEDEGTLFLPNDTGGTGSWSGDGRYFVSSEIQFTSETLAPRSLLLFDIQDETILDLSRGNFLEDLNPSFSPFGLTVAYSRKSLDPQDWSPGRQLWIMDINTGDDQQLTDEVDFHHTSFAWHPDGDQMAFVRYNQAKLSDPPEIWLINHDGTESLRLIINGFAPGWIP